MVSHIPPPIPIGRCQPSRGAVCIIDVRSVVPRRPDESQALFTRAGGTVRLVRPRRGDSEREHTVKDFEGPIPKLYRLTGTPTLYVLDRAGKIAAQINSAEKIEETIQPLLLQREQPRSTPRTQQSCVTFERAGHN
jgi:hypothetical protein